MPVLITGEPSKPRKPKKRGNPVRRSSAVELEYRRSLIRLIGQFKNNVLNINVLIRENANPAEVRAEIERQLNQAQARFDAAASNIAGSFMQQADADNKRKIERTLINGLGIDSARIIDTPAVRDKIDIATAENVSLIKSIPQEFYGDVAQAVFQNYRGEKFEEGSLLNRLKKIGSISERRAKLIARDQTAKFVSSVNEIRQQDAGIESYIWRNMQDERVVGNPGGLYPKGNARHRDHWSREGKEFKWSEPPSDGHPGEAIQCRCFAEPIINIDRIRNDAVQL